MPVSTRSKSKKDCLKTQIRNPETGRCVNKKGEIGQALLLKVDTISPKVVKKPCLETQIRNPETGRCVNKNGAIGQALLLKERSAKETDEDIIGVTVKTLEAVKEEHKPVTKKELELALKNLSVETSVSLSKVDELQKELVDNPELQKDVLASCEEVVSRLQETDSRLFRFLSAWCKGIGYITSKVLGATFSYAPLITCVLVFLHNRLEYKLTDTTLRDFHYLLSPLTGYWNFTDYMSIILISVVNNAWPRAGKFLGTGLLIKWFLPTLVRSVFLAFLQLEEMTT